MYFLVNIILLFIMHYLHKAGPLKKKKNITELSCLAVALLILLGTMSLFYKVSLQYVCV